LLDAGRCALVDDADVVVTDCGVGRSEELVAALTDRGVSVVLEAPSPMLDRYASAGGGKVMLAYPVTESALRAAVAEAAGRVQR
jgi:hypothetical protein